MSDQDSLRFYKTQQVAEILQISPATVMRWCRTGELRASRVAESWRISEGALAEFMRNCELEAGTKPAKPRPRKKRIA